MVSTGHKNNCRTSRPIESLFEANASLRRWFPRSRVLVSLRDFSAWLQFASAKNMNFRQYVANSRGDFPGKGITGVESPSRDGDQPSTRGQCPIEPSYPRSILVG